METQNKIKKIIIFQKAQDILKQKILILIRQNLLLIKSKKQKQIIMN